jgi:hypothetical protein
MPSPLNFIGVQRIGIDRQPWHLFGCASSGLLDTWKHQTEDDFGHVFTFFWHPLNGGQA